MIPFATVTMHAFDGPPKAAPLLTWSSATKTFSATHFTNPSACPQPVSLRIAMASAQLVMVYPPNAGSRSDGNVVQVIPSWLFL